ncbi:MAG: hypothetical protein IKW53_03425, partial [Clostridia bacterium]|nr:hypothetical protein [Clostridia bacterium]
MKTKIIALLLLVVMLLTACNNGGNINNNNGSTPGVPGGPGGPGGNNTGSDIKGDDTSYGDNLEDMGAMDGYFDEELCDIEIKCIAGT